MISLGWTFFPIYNDNVFNENIGVDKDRIARGKKSKSKFRFISQIHYKYLLIIIEENILIYRLFFIFFIFMKINK